MQTTQYYIEKQSSRVYDYTWNPGDRYEIMTAKAGKIAVAEQAKNDLRQLLQPGSTVYTNIHHVSKSGMSRNMTLHIVSNGEIQNITYWAALALNKPLFDDELKVSGCGMDMGFHIVYCLSRALFPDGFAVAGVGRNGDTSGHDEDGGYALKQSWL